MFIKRRPTQTERYVLADLIRHGRESQNFTQEQLAAFLDCSRRWISDIEQGKCDPTWRDTLHLAAIVKLEPIVFAEEAGLYVPVPSH